MLDFQDSLQILVLILAPARQARRRYPGLSVLLVTAYVQDALGATDLGGAGINVLSKPFNLSELIDWVETCLPQ